MIALTITFALAILLINIIYLDITKKLPLLNKYFMGVFFIFAPHIVLLWYFFSEHTKLWHSNLRYSSIILAQIILFIVYIWLKLTILPVITKQPVSLRLRIMLSGRNLVIYGLYAAVLQLPTYVIVFSVIQCISIPKYIFITDIILTLLVIIALLIDGMLKLLFTSRRLAILKRHSVAFMAFIPIMNIFIMLYACSIATIEYENECYKEIKDNIPVDSDVCKTKYPIVLVHGFAFRDLRDANYWGRIPNALIRSGADIYYGNQDAWGTIEHNAQCLKDRILDIVNKTGCEKVNIIAHSKGGLDSRYMLAKLNMHNYVASLTTMSSPHRGSPIMNIGYKLPDKIYKAIANFFDNSFRFLGDKNPDFYNASKQLSTYNTKKFNDEVNNVYGVYYQSYMTIMSSIFSDYILSVPYIFLKFREGKNDGLVSVDSAKWGEFKGVLTTSHRRGISHGDIIDFRRDTYKEFNVLEKYIEIVSELKNSGY